MSRNAGSPDGLPGPCELHDPPHDSLRRASRKRRIPRHSLRPIVALLLAAGIAAAGLGAGVTRASAESPLKAPASASVEAEALITPPFAFAPLDTPLIVTGSFGERRPRHFHAGLDLSTGGVIGRPVRAPADGWLERVRTQGSGYGRSLYLRTDAGLLIVFGHLDAFAEPIASWVAAAQDSSGRYEQDLWPTRDRFPIRAGQLLAWSGKTGTSQPHLHVEVRRGDMAYNPLHAGIPVADAWPPILRRLVLEPLDDHSWVERGAGPMTLSLAGAQAETVVVEGRVRALVRADDPGARGARLVPSRVRLTWGGDWIEWRADSASWVSDMAEVDYVYDTERAVSGGGPYIQMWAPKGWRPALLATGTPDSLPAGRIEVEPGAPARPLELWVKDPAGRTAQRTVWIRGPRPDEGGPATGAPARAPRRGRVSRAAWFEWTALPDEALRASYHGAPPDVRDVTLMGRAATFRDGAWHVVLSRRDLGDVLRPIITGVRAHGAAWSDTARPLAVTAAVRHGDPGRLSPFDWAVPARAPFEPATLLYDVVGSFTPGNAELVPLSDLYAIEPANLPLRSAVLLWIRPRGLPPGRRAALYRDAGAGWEWVGGADSTEARVGGGSRTLGRFAAFADTLAPRLGPIRAPRRAMRGPYSSWALTARVSEYGSGVDASTSYFEVDGRRVPTEVDAVRDLFRWRPLVPPARGTHKVTLEARDRAGNLRRASRTFVIN